MTDRTHIVAPDADPVRITFLGGLGEIGRNCAALETRGRIVVLDCGQMFAGDDLPESPQATDGTAPRPRPTADTTP